MFMVSHVSVIDDDFQDKQLFLWLFGSSWGCSVLVDVYEGTVK